jgi:16S rRNA pseudouridine516 synthase
VRRIDQWLSNLGYCSRREARDWARSGRLAGKGGQVISDCSRRIAAGELWVDGEGLDHPDGLLLMLHKPLGVVCSRDTGEGRRIYDLLPDRWNRRDPAVTSVGRLDRDTSGLLLLTDQTGLVHRLTSPKHKVPKRYKATLAQPVPLERQKALTETFAAGTLALDDEPCLPAELNWRSPTEAELVLTEGRFHQVRRMFALVDLSVVALHRTHFGRLALDNLAPSEFRELPLDYVFA